MPKELLGQFLIRRGKVKQEDIDEVLILQDILRDSLGSAALANDYVTFKDVGRILEYMDNHDVNFSEAAVELNILTQQQIEELKSKAADCDLRLGQLLVATTKLTQEELEEELALFNKERLLISSPNVTKAELVKSIASATGVDRKTVKRVVESVFETISMELSRGNSVILKGFGSFKTRQYSGRIGRNPKTGEPISVPARKVVQLKYSRRLREYVNKGKC